MVDALARFAQVRQFGSLFRYEIAPERGWCSGALPRGMLLPEGLEFGSG